MSLPQIILTLAPGGELKAELPGANGARRQILLQGPAEEQISALRRILQGQLASSVEIGLDGAPTEAQARHWQRHSEAWGDPNCKFCLAEGRFDGGRNRSRRKVIELAQNGQGSEQVKIRRTKDFKSRFVLVEDPDGGCLPKPVLREEAKARGLREIPKVQRTRMSLEDLGI